MTYPNFSISPIYIGDTVVHSVPNYKILGVYMDNNLKWNSHVDYIERKASKRLYSLRLLKRAGVEPYNIVKVYSTTIRPILEYAAPVWQAIPEVLSAKIESVQKRALRIIYPRTECYQDALTIAELEPLSTRRDSLCTRYMDNIKSSIDHPLRKLLPRDQPRDLKYNLRTKKEKQYIFHDREVCKTKRSQDFFMFKYS